MKNLKAWLPAALWMIVIFCMSAAPGDVSSEQSGTIVRLILFVHGLFFGDVQLSSDVLALFETIIRKAAHMSEYAVLALLYLYALRKNNAHRPMLVSILLCALYAASDEFHQSFVPDRGPSVIDVAIDCAGSCLGLFFAQVITHLRRKTT